jgi:hypothetical protein
VLHTALTHSSINVAPGGEQGIDQGTCLLGLGLRGLADCRFGLRLQLIDAARCSNRSAGVSNFNVSRGRSFSLLAMAVSLFW